MLELSAKTNLLEENDYRYSLQDVKDPVLYRDVYNYDEVPKVAFNHRRRIPVSLMPRSFTIRKSSRVALIQVVISGKRSPKA